MERIAELLERVPGGLLAAVLALAGLSMFVSLIRRGLAMSVGKRQQARARVVEKYAEPDERGKTVYTVVFESGGLVLRLVANERQFEPILPGQKGILHYSGRYLDRFQPRRG